MPYLADTNLIVRLLVRDDEKQFSETVKALTGLEERSGNCFVPDVVWIESCWVLEKIYKLNRPAIANALLHLLETELFVPMSNLVHETLSVYAESSVDLVDIYLAAMSKSSRHTVLTWNHKDFRKLDCEWMTPASFNSPNLTEA